MIWRINDKLCVWKWPFGNELYGVALSHYGQLSLWARFSRCFVLYHVCLSGINGWQSNGCTCTVVLLGHNICCLKPSLLRRHPRFQLHRKSWKLELISVVLGGHLSTVGLGWRRRGGWRGGAEPAEQNSCTRPWALFAHPTRILPELRLAPDSKPVPSVVHQTLPCISLSSLTPWRFLYLRAAQIIKSADARGMPGRGLLHPFLRRL